MAPNIDHVKTIKEKVLLLSTLNVLEPLTLKEIESELSDRISKNRIKDIVDSLVKDNYTRRNSNGEYILSYRGIHAFTRSPLKRERDIQRMLFLSKSVRRGKD